MVIGDKAEDALRQSMLMSHGSLGILFSNGLVTTLMVLALVLLLLPLLGVLVRPVARERHSVAGSR
jgi:TctA family transporter